MVKTRCPWPSDNQVMLEYHDTEWGVPVHTDNKHFEFIVLDSFQAGLSWSIVLKKRDGFRNAFSGFDPVKVAKYSKQNIEEILKDRSIVRNRLKVECTVSNARAFLLVQKEFGSFDEYIWKFVQGKPIVNSWKRPEDVPATSPQSDAMSKDLKIRGFKFVGSTICYAYMQAAGMVNDHLVDCLRYSEV